MFTVQYTHNSPHVLLDDTYIYSSAQIASYVLNELSDPFLTSLMVCLVPCLIFLIFALHPDSLLQFPTVWMHNRHTWNWTHMCWNLLSNRARWKHTGAWARMRERSYIMCTCQNLKLRCDSVGRLEEWFILGDGFFQSSAEGLRGVWMVFY